jgi:hypothetical protein
VTRTKAGHSYAYISSVGELLTSRKAMGSPDRSKSGAAMAISACSYIIAVA